MEKQQERVDDAGLAVEEGASLYGADGFVGGDEHHSAYQVVLSAPTLEQAEVLREFGAMLAAPSRDGGNKRAAGLKVSWKIDPGHQSALYRHLESWECGERHDPDNGCHPLIAVAWRALAVAWQETQSE